MQNIKSRSIIKELPQNSMIRSIFFKKSAILLPTGKTLIKVITSKVEECIKICIPTLNKLLLAGMGTKENVMSIVPKQLSPPLRSGGILISIFLLL